MIVACAGGKGGVGTSTVARALADRLDAVLVETDVAMGSPAPEEPTLAAVLAGRVPAPRAVRAGREQCLPAGGSLREASAGDLRRLAPALRAVEQSFGAVVVDCPSGLSAAVGAALLAADGCVLVTAPDETAIVAGLRLRALARRLDAGLVRVALTRSEEAPAAVERAFGAPAIPLPSPPAPDTERGVARLARAVQTDCRSS